MQLGFVVNAQDDGTMDVLKPDDENGVRELVYKSLVDQGFISIPDVNKKK